MLEHVSKEYDANTIFLVELQQKCLRNATGIWNSIVFYFIFSSNRVLKQYYSVMSYYGFVAKSSKNSCPRIFDGWACWEETLPNKTAFAQCPYYMMGFDPSSKFS